MELNAGFIPTNEDICAFVEENYGFKVHSAYIGQVREKLGIREHENFNDSNTSPRKPTICPEEKAAAIVDALKHFGAVKKVPQHRRQCRKALAPKKYKERLQPVEVAAVL